MTKRIPLLTCFNILTVGLPFCAFKIVTAIYLLNFYKEGAFTFSLAGVLMGLGLIDSFFNLGNLITLVIKKDRYLPICLFTLISEKILRHFEKSPENYLEFGAALDTLLAFLLVALMILDGALGQIEPWQLTIWNWSVVLNVLGAGLGRLWTAWSLIKEKRQKQA